MTEEMNTATPAGQEAAEQVQQVEITSTEATTEQTQEQETSQEQEQESQEEKAKREPWFQKRIGELTREKYEARRAAEMAEQRAREIEQRYAQQFQQGDQTQQQNPQAPQVDVRTLAQQEAARMVAEQRFHESCNKVYATGKTEFQDFDQAVANLQMVGVNRDFLELAATSDAGHKVIHHLGSDLDEAARILALPPVQMARELTKLEFKLSQPPAPKPVSKAPAPITPIGGGGATDSGLRDDLPIDEWMRRHSQRK